MKLNYLSPAVKYCWNWTKDVEVTEEGEEFARGRGERETKCIVRKTFLNMRLQSTKKTELCSRLSALRAEVSLSYETGLTEHKAR